MSDDRPAAETGTYVAFDREAWAALRASTPLTLTEDDLAGLRGIDDALDLDEVVDVYLPLSRLLNLNVTASRALERVTDTFLGRPAGKVPYLIGVAGSVAVGKSTTSRILQALLARWPDHPRVEIVTTDGFLYPNATLVERGIMERKGFPESYDTERLVRFVADLKAGEPEVRAPLYAHDAYDIVPGEWQVVAGADVVIVEGLNILQVTPRAGEGGSVFPSDFLDFSIYVDAAEHHILDWYATRFLRLKELALASEDSYFHEFAHVDDAMARSIALDVWARINHPNLVDHIRPTRDRASLVLTKGADHRVTSVLLRRR
ncbi:MAG TPA: type I pantothenate kinase [Acidimicrobiales bacterium]